MKECQFKNDDIQTCLCDVLQEEGSWECEKWWDLGQIG